VFKQIAAVLLVGVLGVGPVGAAPPLFLTPVTDLEGKPVPPERLTGRITCLIIANRANADRAAALGQDLVFKFSTNRSFAFVTVADLRGVPDFARTMATGMIQDQLTKARVELKNRFIQAGRTYEPGLWIYIPDWEGNTTLNLLKASPEPEYAIFDRNPAQLPRFERTTVEREQQKLRSLVHIFILDRSGEVKYHFQEVGSAAAITNALRTLLTDQVSLK